MSTVAHISVALASLAVSALVGWSLTALVLRLADRSRRAVPPPSDDPAAVRTPADGPDSADVREHLRGGTWIGILERVAVTGTLLAGEPSGIAVVVAVKGLGRYPELRSGDSPGVSERFVIGTLTSLVWSAAVGLLGRWLLTR